MFHRLCVSAKLTCILFIFIEIDVQYFNIRYCYTEVPNRFIIEIVLRECKSQPRPPWPRRNLCPEFLALTVETANRRVGQRQCNSHLLEDIQWLIRVFREIDKRPAIP